MLGFQLLQTLGAQGVDRLGDWNPQLLREWKGRLKRFPVVAAIGISLLVQGVLMLSSVSMLPGPVVSKDLVVSTYPQFRWDGIAALDSALQPEVTLPDGQTLTLTSSILVERLDQQSPIGGDLAAGEQALQQLQIGDRLIAINGEPVIFNTDDERQQLSFHVNQRITNQLSPISVDSGQGFRDSVELTLLRPDQELFMVSLPRITLTNHHNRYCLYGDSYQGCDVTPDGQFYQIDWRKWYGDGFWAITVAMVFSLMGIGVFLLGSNLAEEKRRGTLNFIRLSPRSAANILAGKLLGVPVCLYLAIALALPLHGFLGLGAGYSIGHGLGLYGAIASQTVVFYLAALLVSLCITHPMLLGLQPWLMAAGVTLFQWIVLVALELPWGLPHIDASGAWLWSVFFSPLVSLAYFAPLTDAAYYEKVVDNLALGLFRINFAEYTVLTVLHAMGWTYLLGQASVRRFRQATRPLLPRALSYGLTLGVMAVLLGLTETDANAYYLDEHLTAIVCLFLVYFTLLTLSLVCDRQTLQDWARFRHTRPKHIRMALWKDLLWGEESSPLLAIALNLLMATILFVGWFFWNYGDRMDTPEALQVFALIVAMAVGSLFFATLASQVVLLLPRKKNGFWFGATSSISAVAFPCLTALLVIAQAEFYPHITTLLGMESELGLFTLTVGLMAMVTTGLGFCHYRQLAISGRSELQHLLKGAS